MALMAAAPAAVAVGHECRGVPDEPVRGRSGELDDDGPVGAGPAHVPLTGADLAILQVADVDGEHPARPKRPGHGDQRPVDRRGVRQVADHVADRYDRVRGGQRVIGQRELAQVCLLTQLRPGLLQHRRRGVGGDDPVPGGQQVAGQRPGAAAELQDDPVVHRRQEVQDTRGAVVGVAAVTPRVDQGEVVLVVIHAKRPGFSRRR